MTEACAEPHPDAAQVFIEAAEALAPLIARHKRALSAGPDLPLEIGQALEAAGLTRMWLPRNLGGAELAPVGYFRVIEALSRYDGSVGWSASIASTGSRVAGLIAQSSAAELLAEGGLRIGKPQSSRQGRQGKGRLAGLWTMALGQLHCAQQGHAGAVRGIRERHLSLDQ
jgi:alkylation response protein AidB-like acyl-CoA dehydrogenase